jgi:uncharacterized protein involved in response to NO
MTGIRAGVAAIANTARRCTSNTPVELARPLSAAPHRLPFFVGAATALAAWLWLLELPLLALALLTLWKRWPRGPMPALRRVLFLGYAWLPIALALYAGQSLWMFAMGEFALGRGPVYALSIGLFGSLLVAMVTRVTQGHSGRPLVLGRAALFAFVGMQIFAVLRVVGERVPSPMDGYRAAALGGLLVFLPWVLRSLWIYLRLRADGKPG